MENLWLCLVSVMVGLYVVFDGFDIGTGIIHLIVARNAEERRLVLRTIGPVWDGNEVWLLAGGGTLYFAFPAVYASGFSGFYLPLMILLWLLILRGISIEFRNHIRNAVWIPLWDVVFFSSSLLIAIILGAALGNVVRGVPMNEKGYFFVPLWTNFGVGPDPGVLDWYTVLVGLAALFTLAVHGALWVAMKTQGPVAERSSRVANIAWWPVAILTAVVTCFTFQVQPQVPRNLAQYSWGYIFPALALGGLFLMPLFLSRAMPGRAFLASSAYILGMLTSAVFGIYPSLLPSTTNSGLSLTVANSKAPDYGLRVGLVWWIIGMTLATGYFVYVYRHFRGKVTPGTEGDGY